MTDGAPKRIWAWPHFDGWITGDWSANTYHDERTVAYILVSEHDRLMAEKDAEIERLRETAMPTDVLDEVERALVNAGVVLHRAQVTATMDCINASVSDPLRKNIENWRARCVVAECDAGTALDRIRAAREMKCRWTCEIQNVWFCLSCGAYVKSEGRPVWCFTTATQS